MHKRTTRAISLGGLSIGGGAPVMVQSMTNTDTRDAEATLAQIARLEARGCEAVRVAVPHFPATALNIGGRSLWILIVVMAAYLSAGGKNVCTQALAKNFARHVPESFAQYFSQRVAGGQPCPLKGGKTASKKFMGQAARGPCGQAAAWRAHLACRGK